MLRTSCEWGKVLHQHTLTPLAAAYKIESKERPNYGKAAGMSSPNEWWANVSYKALFTIGDIRMVS